MDISNQVAVITGGGSGMGAATARELAAKGAKVAIFDKQIEKAQQLAQEISACAYSCDVTNSSEIESALTAVTQKWDTPRIIVNCAGIAVAQTMINKEGQEIPLENFSRVIEINLIGTFNVMRLAAAKIAKAEPLNSDGERGVIINTASIAAFEGQIGQTAYSASKGGVVGMTLPAARELSRFGIRVVTIAPGLVETPMLQELPNQVREGLGATVPFPKRLGKPSEYAMLVEHIISNPMINGTVIRLDGALRMPPK